MSLFQIKWLRRLLRRKMVPMPQQSAAHWKQRLSIVYMIVAWNAFGAICYMAYTGRRDWADHYGYKTDEDKAISPGLQWAKTLDISKAKIVRYSGFEKVNEIEYSKEEQSNKENSDDKQLLVEVVDEQ